MDRCRCAGALDEPAANQLGLAAPEAFHLRIPVAPRNCGFESLCSIRRRSLVFQLARPARKSSNRVQSSRLPLANEKLSAERVQEEGHYSEADCFQLPMPFSPLPRDQAAAATK
jgi:hypothetical protein